MLKTVYCRLSIVSIIHTTTADYVACIPSALVAPHRCAEVISRTVRSLYENNSLRMRYVHTHTHTHTHVSSYPIWVDQSIWCSRRLIYFICTSFCTTVVHNTARPELFWLSSLQTITIAQTLSIGREEWNHTRLMLKLQNCGLLWICCTTFSTTNRKHRTDPQQSVTSLCSANMYADNMALLAFARRTQRCCAPRC